MRWSGGPRAGLASVEDMGGLSDEQSADELNSLRPGEYFWVKFNDEDIWTELLSLWAATRKKWVVLTPDEERTELDLSAQGKHIEYMVRYGSSGGFPQVLRKKSLYRFDEDEVFSAEEVAKHIKRAIKHAKKERGDKFIKFSEMYNFYGELDVPSSVLGLSPGEVDMQKAKSSAGSGGGGAADAQVVPSNPEAGVGVQLGSLAAVGRSRTTQQRLLTTPGRILNEPTFLNCKRRWRR